MKSRPRDRRAGGRVEVNFPARLSMSGANPVANLMTPVVDLSSSGLRLHSKTALPTNRMATIEATCDGTQYVTRGRIVRIEEAGDGGYFIGIEFDPLMLEENPFPTSVLVVHHDMPEFLPPREPIAAGGRNPWG